MIPTKEDEYFRAKKNQPRKEVANLSGLAFKAIEIALRVYRLHFPAHAPTAYRIYWNNGPREFKDWLVADIYFMSGNFTRQDEKYEGPAPEYKEDGGFMVEVKFLPDRDKAIVRWLYDFGTTVPMAGETFVLC